MENAAGNTKPLPAAWSAAGRGDFWRPARPEPTGNRRRSPRYAEDAREARTPPGGKRRHCQLLGRPREAVNFGAWQGPSQPGTVGVAHATSRTHRRRGRRRGQEAPLPTTRSAAGSSEFRRPARPEPTGNRRRSPRYAEDAQEARTPPGGKRRHCQLLGRPREGVIFGARQGPSRPGTAGVAHATPRTHRRRERRRGQEAPLPTTRSAAGRGDFWCPARPEPTGNRRRSPRYAEDAQEARTPQGARGATANY